MLPYCAERFSTIEINNSFYRLPSRETFETWRKMTPKNFVFAVKASRYITHNKKLSDPSASVERFADSVIGLGSKLGIILFQLPPRWSRNVARLEEFLSRLPRKWRYAFEFRDQSWYSDDAYDVLKLHHAAFCVYELAGHQSPKVLTAKFAYLRLHGPEQGKYSGRYSREQLRKWLGWCREWLNQGAEHIFVYFDNDQAGYAALNAMELQQMASS